MLLARLRQDVIIFELLLGLAERVVLRVRLREDPMVRGGGHRLSYGTSLHLVLERTDLSFFFLRNCLWLRLRATRAVLRVQERLADLAAALVREKTPATDQPSRQRVLRLRVLHVVVGPGGQVDWAEGRRAPEPLLGGFFLAAPLLLYLGPGILYLLVGRIPGRSDAQLLRLLVDGAY